MTKMRGNLKREMEFKWHVEDAKDYLVFLRALKSTGIRMGLPHRVMIRDWYVDLRGGLLNKAGIKCRLRTVDGRFEMTFKSSSPLRQGFVKRFEKTVKLPRAFSGRDGAIYVERFLQQQFGFLTKPMTLFRVDNRRVRRQIFLRDQTQAELSFDNVLLVRGARRIKMKEIELEYQNGNLKLFKSFAAQMSLRSHLPFQNRSKVATAMKFFFPRGQYLQRLSLAKRRQVFRKIFVS